MANTVITTDHIIRETFMHLYENLTAARLVWRDYSSQFAAGRGATVTYRKPAVFVADEYDRADGITVQDLTETTGTVTLDTILDVSIELTDEELSLDIEDLSRQYLQPAGIALAQGIDKAVLAVLAGAGITQTVGTNGTTPTDPTILVDAGKLLRDQNVPLGSNTYAILTTAAGAEFMKDPLFHAADQRGDTEGLREASIGRKFAFDNYISTNLPSGGESVAFHQTAVSLVTRTLAPPRGGASSSVFSYDGFGLRLVEGYDMDKKKNILSLDCLLGVDIMAATRAVKILG